MTLIKNAVCGTIIDPDRLLLGAEEGLFCVDLDNCGECSAGVGRGCQHLYVLADHNMIQSW